MAERLARLFQEYGPPLFINRDNGGDLNHGAVDKVLGEFMVIPLNSLPYYPPDNGVSRKVRASLKRD